jgi:hypothetical protein
MMMAAPSVLLIAGLRSQGTIGHYARMVALAIMILLVVAVAAGIAWATTRPKDATEKLKQIQARKMAERPEPRTASRHPQI